MPGGPGVAQYIKGKVYFREVVALGNGFPLPMVAFTQEHVVYGAQEERTGQGLRVAIQDPERDKVGRPNQTLREEEGGGDLRNSDSCGWLWSLVPDGSRNLSRLSGCLPELRYLLESQEECWSGQVSLKATNDTSDQRGSVGKKFVPD